MASRQEDLREALGYQFAAWRSPDGVSEHTGFELEVPVEETLVEEEPEVQVDETLVDVLRIFDEGQAKANSLYGLLDQAPSPTPPFCTNKINIDDYSEDSRP